MSIEKAQALVLRKRDFRETSLIVDFYSREFGKISGLLKGVRSDPGKFGSNLEFFSLNEFVFYRKSSTSYTWSARRIKHRILRGSGRISKKPYWQVL